MNKRVYIGSSCDVERRLKTHKNKLLLGKHDCEELQADFTNLDGFSFEIITECLLIEKREKERYYVLLNAENCYNKNVWRNYRTELYKRYPNFNTR